LGPRRGKKPQARIGTAEKTKKKGVLMQKVAVSGGGKERSQGRGKREGGG